MYIFLIFHLFSGIYCTVAAEEELGCFRWFLFYVEGNMTLCPVETDQLDFSVLQKNLRFYFQPVNKAFLYVLLIGKEDTLSLIFPPSFDYFTNHYESVEQIIPEGGDWSSFKKKPGKYELSFLVAQEPLLNLEKLLKEYFIAGKQTSSSKQQKILKEKILSELAFIKTESLLQSNNSEEFIQVNGTFRTYEELYKNIKNVTFKDLFTKKYTLEFQ